MVMVRKSNSKWRMCINFTNLNKACLKNYFLLPHIDQLIDATFGHTLVLWMPTPAIIRLKWILLVKIK